MSDNRPTDQQIKDAGAKSNPIPSTGMDANRRNRVDALWKQAQQDAQKKK
jgi:hypothetical protein